MTEIAVALIGLVGIVLAALIQAGRKENKNDHNLVVRSMERIETKIDGHINEHARGDLRR